MSVPSPHVNLKIPTNRIKTATDKKIRQNTTTACVEILTDYADVRFLTIDSPQHSFVKQMQGELDRYATS